MYSTICMYKETCPSRSEGCMETQMTEIHAKPIVDGKFWIVEQDGTKIATLHKKENNKFVLSSTNGEIMFNKKDELVKQFGKDFIPSKPNVYDKKSNSNTQDAHEAVRPVDMNIVPSFVSSIGES